MRNEVNEVDCEDIEPGDKVLLENDWLVEVDSLFGNGFFVKSKQKPRMDEEVKILSFKDVVKNFKTLTIDEIEQYYPEYFI